MDTTSHFLKNKKKMLGYMTDVFTRNVQCVMKSCLQGRPWEAINSDSRKEEVH